MEGNAASPAELSAIAIFDAHCARAYVDNHGDFSYVPYGLDILEGLAKVCAHVKDRANADLRAAHPNLDVFKNLSQSSTEAGRLALGLSAKTNKADVERLGTLSEAEVQRLTLLIRTLSETDPKNKAAELRAKAQRIESLAGRITELMAIVSDQKIADLRALIRKADAAKAAAASVANRFEEAGGLEGTGNEAWVELFRAARAFCVTSRPVFTFPKLTADASCPLCQNTLGVAGASRLVAFDEFIQGEATSAATKARREAADAFRTIVDAPLDIALDEALKHDLESQHELAEECSAVQLSARARREATRAAATPKSGSTWDQVPTMVHHPTARLVALAAQIRQTANVLESTTDAKDRAAMDKELADLKGRQQLSELKTIVLSAIDKFMQCDRLSRCVTAAATTSISRKSTELTNIMATQEVADALNAELQALGVYEIKVSMKPSSAKAKTTFKLVLENEAGGSPADVLSEGEQRAIAIASFLAEVKLSKGHGGVVFDDPVSSLDHARRERVAKRLAAESGERQVVVFTHDIFFLSVLIDEATAKGFNPMALTLNRTTEGFGVANSSLPFAGAGVKARVGMLRNKQVDCSRLQKTGDHAGYRLHARDFYNDLRMTWERAVEELLFNSVVVRFRKSIQTNRLDRVQVTAGDLSAINDGMTKCSNYTGHDGAMEANILVPSPQDMENDLDALERWRKTATDRLNRK